ncbi:hypothetical protein C8R48DRAFT_764784 [Suillus tomentosus]|nr:hypothetical protein C8R48DRAFT_764784 [Suillus tomentosus]
MHPSSIGLASNFYMELSTPIWGTEPITQFVVPEPVIPVRSFTQAPINTAQQTQLSARLAWLAICLPLADGPVGVSALFYNEYWVDVGQTSLENDATFNFPVPVLLISVSALAQRPSLTARDFAEIQWTIFDGPRTLSDLGVDPSRRSCYIRIFKVILWSLVSPPGMGDYFAPKNLGEHELHTEEQELELTGMAGVSLMQTYGDEGTRGSEEAIYATWPVEDLTRRAVNKERKREPRKADYWQWGHNQPISGRAPTTAFMASQRDTVQSQSDEGGSMSLYSEGSCIVYNASR